MTKFGTALVVGAALFLGGCSALVGSDTSSRPSALANDADVSAASRAYTDGDQEKRSYGWDLRDAQM